MWSQWPFKTTICMCLYKLFLANWRSSEENWNSHCIFTLLKCREWKRKLLKILNWKVGIFVEDLTVSQSVSLQAGRLLGYFIKWKKSLKKSHFGLSQPSHKGQKVRLEAGMIKGLWRWVQELRVSIRGEVNKRVAQIENCPKIQSHKKNTNEERNSI